MGRIEQIVGSLLQYRVFSLVMGVFMCLVAGTLYNFSAYAPSMKNELGYTQTQVNMIGTIGDVGIYVGFTMGIVYDHFGHRFSASVSAAMIAVGYTLSALSAYGYLPSSYLLLSLFYFVVGQGSYGVEISALDSNMKNWHPNNRGIITGILVGGFGLSSGFFTILYDRLFSQHDTVAHFLLFMAISVSLVSIIGGFCLKIEPPVETQEDKEKQGETQSLLAGTQSVVKPDLTPVQLLKNIDFWLIFACFTTASGAGLMVINNVGSIRLTFGGKAGDLEGSILVGTLSLCNFLGRILFGILSDNLQARIPRAVWLAIANVIMGLFHLLFFLAPGDGMLYILAGGTGLAYGGCFQAIPTLMSLFFGMKHFGANFGASLVAPAIGTFSFGYMAGALYEAEVQHGETQCYGEDCYRITFMISAILSFIGAGIAVLLTIRRKRQYRN